MERLWRADQLQHISLAMLPPELVISKLVSARSVSADLARKNPLQMHLRVKEWSEDGEVRGVCAEGWGGRGAFLAMPASLGAVSGACTDKGRSPGIGGGGH